MNKQYDLRGGLGVREGRRESSLDQKGNGKAPQAYPGPKRKSAMTWPRPTGKGKKASQRNLRSNSTRQPDPMYSHKNETKRFPG
jgi:hypothetical protein